MHGGSGEAWLDWGWRQAVGQPRYLLIQGLVVHKQ